MNFLTFVSEVGFPIDRSSCGRCFCVYYSKIHPGAGDQFSERVKEHYSSTGQSSADHEQRSCED